VELWLKDPVTRTYLQCLWWSQDQLREALGNGAGINLASMEETFSKTVITEGKKQGYMSALAVQDELRRHEMLDPEAVIEMPEFKNEPEEI